MFTQQYFPWEVTVLYIVFNAMLFLIPYYWKSRAHLTPEGKATLTPENFFILTPLKS